jgi:predicted nucleic acid-binding protein
MIKTGSWSAASIVRPKVNSGPILPFDVVASSRAPKPAVSFPVPRKAAYVKFKNPASRFALVGDVLPLIDVVFVDEPVQRAALSALLAAGRRRLSLVDCVSFEVMRRRSLNEAFAFDRHFEEAGFSVVAAD